MLLVVSAGSVLLGLVLSRLVMTISARITDVPTAVIFQFCTGIGVWILAERLHLSGIITTVVFAMAASRAAPEIVPARIRIPSWAVWEVAVFVLNVLAFILVGIQLRSIGKRLDGELGFRYTLIACAVCLTVILARIVWVTGAAAFSRWLCRARSNQVPPPHDAIDLTPGGAALIGWCGMRGTVTLAAALALPAGGPGTVAFPYRDLVVVCAFGVVLGTLVLQGLTVRPLLVRLRLKDDGAVDREVQLARVETLRAALSAASTCPEAATAILARNRYEFQLKRAEQEFHSPEQRPGTALTGVCDGDANVIRTAAEAQRHRLVALRNDGTIGDAAFQRIEEELDWAELDWDQLLRPSK